MRGPSPSGVRGWKGEWKEPRLCGLRDAAVADKKENGRRWVRYVPADQGVSVRRWMSQWVARRRTERERRRTERRFRGAPFPLYGLPPSWQGDRSLGGGGWSGRTGELISSLSLVHGALVEGEGPMLTVETALPDEAHGGGRLRVLAEEVWSGRAWTIVQALDHLRAPWPIGLEFDATPPSRTTELVVVDQVPVEFDVFSHPDHWVAASLVGGYRVTLEAERFPIQGLQLVRVTDLEPYMVGTRRFETGA